MEHQTRLDFYCDSSNAQLSQITKHHHTHSFLVILQLYYQTQREHYYLSDGSGASLTNLNASNISSGTIGAARIPTLNQDTTGNAATSTLATNAQGLTGTPNITVGSIIASSGTFSGNVTHRWCFNI